MWGANTIYVCLVSKTFQSEINTLIDFDFNDADKGLACKSGGLYTTVGAHGLNR